jgi:(1->4)-alpha-D-glucan 1-alpha-D-glucosylmutase
LRYRRAHPALFCDGDYVKLECLGSKNKHLFAFARLHSEGTVLTIVPRFPTRLVTDPRTLPLGDMVWGDTCVAVPAWREGTRFRDIFTGKTLCSVAHDERQVLPVGQVLEHCPVACLEKEG